MGPSGAAVFEAVPGREEYGAAEDGAAEWEEIMLEFAEDNFNDAGIEVRKTLSDSERANPLTGGGGRKVTLVQGHVVKRIPLGSPAERGKQPVAWGTYGGHLDRPR